MTIIIDTPEGIDAFARLQLVHALALEINTPMQAMRGITSTQLAARHGYTGPTRRSLKNKQAALKWAVAFLQEIDPEYEATSVVATALAKEA